MISGIFFLATILFLFHEIGVAINPRKTVVYLENMKDKEFFKSDQVDMKEKLSGCWFSLVQLMYLVWTVLGLAFSVQWISFAMLFGIGIVSGLIQKAFRIKESGSSRAALFLRRIDSVLCAIVLFDIFMTHFRSDAWGDGLVRGILGL